jgi:lysophospholipase L1-like esterase
VVLFADFYRRRERVTLGLKAKGHFRADMPHITKMLCGVSLVLCIATCAVAQRRTTDTLQWLDANDARLGWLNVADWEAKTGGMQPVRMPKTWRDKIPERSAERALATAGVALRLRTDSARIAIRLTFIDVPEAANASPESLWERARPPYFDVYRDGKFLANVPAKIAYYQQDVTIFENLNEPKKLSDFSILFPHYYRNAEVIVGGIGIDKDAQILSAELRKVPTVLFHGDSITHGHGVTSPRETYVWQTCEMAGCEPLNLGFGGSAWTDVSVAQYIVSRKDWDILVLMLGTNSFGGSDSSGKPETLSQYREKYAAFLDTVRAAFPAKPILCITPILTHQDITQQRNKHGDLPQDYRNAIQQLVEQRRQKDRALYFLDGRSLINDPLYLMVIDQVHPNEAGSLKMAEGISALLRAMFANLNTATSN